MAIAFAMWWWYCDGASAATEQHIRSRADAVRFHVWSYAHLPLYLGIAVAGAGVERIVHLGTAAELHGTDGLLLASSLAVSMLAMAVIGAAAQERYCDSRRITGQLAVVLLVVVAGVSSAHWPPVGLVVFLATACAAQLSVSAWNPEPKVAAARAVTSANHRVTSA
jgi:low temperature requirement protein LtrA